LNTSLSTAKAKPYVEALLILCAAVWGLTFTAGKVAGQQATPLNATMWRFIIAAFILVPMAFKSSLAAKKLSPADWLGLFVSGLTGLVLYNFFFIRGLSMISASRGSVIVCGSPALIYLGSVIFFREKLTFLRCLGVALSLLGTAWVVTSGHLEAIFAGGLGTGDLIMLGCPLSWTAYSLLAKIILGRVDPLSANAWSVLAAVLLLTILVPATGESFGQAADYSLSVWLALAFLGLGGTALGFTLFYIGISTIGPHRAAAYINLVPVFGVLAGWLLLNERPDLSLLTGLALILLGLRLVQKY
jgi:drug/metabolite transporter (DMT)-like permease